MGDRQHRCLLTHFCIGAITSKSEFLVAREFLHESDLAHGHEITREIESIRAIDGQIIDTDDQLGVGLFPGADGGLLRSAKNGQLGVHLRRVLGGEVLGLV